MKSKTIKFLIRSSDFNKFDGIGYYRIKGLQRLATLPLSSYLHKEQQCHRASSLRSTQQCSMIHKTIRFQQGIMPRISVSFCHEEKLPHQREPRYESYDTRRPSTDQSVSNEGRCYVWTKPWKFLEMYYRGNLRHEHHKPLNQLRRNQRDLLPR